MIVSSQGRTLYALSPETSKHLLCKSGECLRFWPPLTVGSAKTKLKNGAGVQGRLGILRRSNGTLQVTLRGMPLYRYSEDRAKGEAKGQGIESFGGTWHAATALRRAKARTTGDAGTPSMPPPATPPTTELPGADHANRRRRCDDSGTPTTPTPTPTPPPYPYPAY